MAEAHPYVSRRISGPPGAVVDEVRVRLDDGEEVLAVVAVAKIFPTLDLVVVTPWRVLAGLRVELLRAEGERWKVDLAREDVADAEVTGFMDNLKFVLNDGTEVKVGNLIDAHDEGPLREALGLPVAEPERREEASEPPEAVPVSLDDLLSGSDADADATPGPPAATWELYEPPTPAHHRRRRR